MRLTHTGEGVPMSIEIELCQWISESHIRHVSARMTISGLSIAPVEKNALKRAHYVNNFNELQIYEQNGQVVCQKM